MNDADKAGLDRRNTYGEGLEDSGIFDREGAGEIPVATRELRSWGIENDYVIVSVAQGGSGGPSIEFIPLPPSWESFNMKVILFQPELQDGEERVFSAGIGQIPLDGLTFNVDSETEGRLDTFEITTSFTEADACPGKAYAGGELLGSGFLYVKTLDVAQNVPIITNSLLELAAWVNEANGDTIIFSVVLEKNS